MTSSNNLPNERNYVAVDPVNQSLSLEQGPVPTPSTGEVLIKVRAAGINRADLLQRKGAYPPPADASPIMGLEVAGVVQAIGDGVEDWNVGDKVCALTHGGGYADYSIAPASQCLPIPQGFSKAEAAALPEALLTVWHNIFQRARLQPGEKVLIHGERHAHQLKQLRCPRKQRADPRPQAATACRRKPYRSSGRTHRLPARWP